MPNGGENENPIEAIDAAKQSTKKPTALFTFRSVGGDRYGTVC